MRFNRFGISPNISPYLGYQGVKTGINWGTIFSNTQKTLGFINQAVPAFYQIKPIWNNARTMFRVVNEFKKEDPPYNSKTYNNNQTNTLNQRLDNTTENNIKPRFFV